jgi:hypothetical protein
MVYPPFRERHRRLPTGRKAVAGWRATRHTGKIGKVLVELRKESPIVDVLLVTKKSASPGG